MLSFLRDGRPFVNIAKCMSQYRYFKLQQDTFGWSYTFIEYRIFITHKASRWGLLIIHCNKGLELVSWLDLISIGRYCSFVIVWTFKSARYIEKSNRSSFRRNFTFVSVVFTNANNFKYLYIALISEKFVSETLSSINSVDLHWNLNLYQCKDFVPQASSCGCFFHLTFRLIKLFKNMANPHHWSSCINNDYQSS